MAEDSQEQSIGPAKISFATFLLKVLAAGGGGVVGTLILVVIVVLAQSIFNPILNGYETGDTISPIFIFILMVMIFLSSTVGNILSTFLLSLTEREKYTRTSTAIYQVFIVSVIIFLLMVPVYFLTTAIDFKITGYAVALHIIISAQVSALILEIVSNYRYALVGVYGVTFSILMSAAILVGLSGIVESTAILLFMALPVVWCSIAFVQSIVTMLYGWIARVYDKDFLATQTVYGKDYGKDVESEKPETPKAQDEAGADFLRHN